MLYYIMIPQSFARFPEGWESGYLDSARGCCRSKTGVPMGRESAAILVPGTFGGAARRHNRIPQMPD